MPSSSWMTANGVAPAGTPSTRANTYGAGNKVGSSPVQACGDVVTAGRSDGRGGPGQDVRAQPGRVGAEGPQDDDGPAVALARIAVAGRSQQPEQQVLGVNLLVTQGPGLAQGPDQGLLGPRGVGRAREHEPAGAEAGVGPAADLVHVHGDGGHGLGG